MSSRDRGFCYDVDVVLEKTNVSGTYTACECGGVAPRAGAPGPDLWPEGAVRVGRPLLGLRAGAGPRGQVTRSGAGGVAIGGPRPAPSRAPGLAPALGPLQRGARPTWTWRSCPRRTTSCFTAKGRSKGECSEEPSS